MSIHGAAHIKCAVCDNQVSLPEARSNWWLCTSCGIYICPHCYSMFQRSGEGICPGTIVRGVEAHLPHFTRFLPPRREPKAPLVEERSTVVILGDLQNQNKAPREGRVIILDGEDTNVSEEPNEN